MVAFALRLARTMGIPLGELQMRMSGQEFGLHFAAYRAQPWGAERDEVHAAVIAHTVASMSGKTLERSPPFANFLPYSRPAEPELDPLEWARAHGHR